jgi:hypothetical protein
MTQSLELVGLGGANFEKCIGVTKTIHDFYARNFVGTNMSRWDVEDDTYGTKLKLGTRFFTSSFDDPLAVAVPLPSSADLLGVLKKFEGTHLVHTADNVVDYFKKGVDPKTQ